MELIALLCMQCKSPLNFLGEYITKCPACGTPHALVDSGNNMLLSVSYLPYVPKPGVMERSLKMLMVAKLRETNYAASGDGWFEKDHIVFEGDKVSFVESIYDSDSEISIGKMTITPFSKNRFFQRNFNPYRVQKTRLSAGFSLNFIFIDSRSRSGMTILF